MGDDKTWNTQELFSISDMPKNTSVHRLVLFLIRKKKFAERKKQILSQCLEFMFIRPNFGFITMVVHGGSSPHRTVFFVEQLGKTLMNKRPF